MRAERVLIELPDGRVVLATMSLDWIDGVNDAEMRAVMGLVLEKGGTLRRPTNIDRLNAHDWLTCQHCSRRISAKMMAEIPGIQLVEWDGDPSVAFCSEPCRGAYVRRFQENQ